MSIYDSYDLFEIIGRKIIWYSDGTICTVKRAVRKENQQVFAAKLYQANILTAKNEIEMLIRLDHPNIVNIYEIFEDENCIILILQYMQGGQLYDYLGQKVMMNEYHIMQFMKTLIDAVRYCHQINIVHRDIKPENLLLTSKTPEALLKLADFGISKIISDQLLTTNCGTPVYLAPEIWAGKSYDSKVDVWSIGIVTYYLLSGSHPFCGDSQTIGEKIKFDDLRFDEKVWDCISSKAIDLIRKLLEKDPAKRPSAQEATSHIWFTSHVNIPTPIAEDQSPNQITLFRAVNKIRRFNFKRKLKNSKKKIKSLAQAQNIRYPHLSFLVHGKSSESTKMEQYYNVKMKNNATNVASEMEVQQNELMDSI